MGTDIIQRQLTQSKKKEWLSTDQYETDGWIIHICKCSETPLISCSLQGGDIRHPHQAFSREPGSSGKYRLTGDSAVIEKWSPNGFRRCTGEQTI